MLVVSGIMAWESQYVRMSYKFGGILPEDDSTYVEYQKFINQFSEDGNVLAIGYRDEKIWELKNFNRWRKLVIDLKGLTVDVDGTPQHMVDSVFSTGNCYNLEKDTLAQKFQFKQIIDHDPESQQQLDSIRDKLYSLPFYKGLLYQDSTNAGLMMVFLLSAATTGYWTYGPLILKVLFATDPLVSGYILAAEALAWSLATVAVARPLIGRVDVLLAKKPPGASIGSASCVTLALSSRFSNTASMIRSLPCKSAALAVGVMRPSSSAWSCGPKRPLSTRAWVSLAL